MSKRDNPRLRGSSENSGKNKRAAHSIGRDGRLHKDAKKPSAGRNAETAGRSSKDARPIPEKRFSAGRNASPDGRSSSPGRPTGERPARLSSGYRTEAPEADPKLIIGRNPVTEAIKSGRSIDKIIMQKDAEGSARKIASMARESRIQLQYADRAALDRLCPGRPHQGVIAYAAAKAYAELSDVFAAAEAKGEDPLIIVLDGLEDPHNLGAVLRSADGAGAHGVVIPARRAAGLTETVAKASAGAIEYVPVVKVTNISRCLEELKERGLWVAAVDMGGENYCDAELSGPLALVVGGEGQGVSALVRSKADRIVSIPMKGRLSSLNASNAAAVVLYEVLRQRSLSE